MKKVVGNREDVTFRLLDILCPDQDVVFSHLEKNVEIVGKVNFFSSGAADKDDFAIVEVPGILVPLVVPRDRLRIIVKKEQKTPLMINDI